MINRNSPKLPMMLSQLGFVAVLTLMAVYSAKAEDGLHEPEKKEGWRVSVGAAAIYKPEFTGSKDYKTMALPDIKVEYNNVFFASPFEGLGYNAINSGQWRTGPIAKFDFGRKENDHKALKGLGDLDAAAELGGFVEYNIEPFSAVFELRQGVGGHEGLIGETSLNYTGLVETSGPPLFFGLGPRVTFADSHYNNAYFGVNQTQSIHSGLTQYTADSGLVSYGVGGFAMMPLSKSVSLSLFGGYDHLSKVATDSPLIKKRGDENQFMGGVRVSYEF